jgi:hypothetical protein
MHDGTVYSLIVSRVSHENMFVNTNFDIDLRKRKGSIVMLTCVVTDHVNCVATYAHLSIEVFVYMHMIIIMSTFDEYDQHDERRIVEYATRKMICRHLLT